MADIKHAVFRSDLMAGTEDYGQLKSAKFYKGDDATAIDNGNIVVLNSLVEDEREIFKATAPATASTKPSQLYVTAGVVLFYDESVRHYEDEWENAADVPVRVYKLHDGDIFSVTAEAFSGSPAVDKYVGIADGSTKLNVEDAAAATTFGKIIDVETVGRYTYYGILVDTAGV